MSDKNYNFVLKKHIDFFNEIITRTLTKYYLSDEIQKLLNKENEKRKIYLKQHFIKTYNLLLSIIILAKANNIKQLIDEAKIIFRSLFENIINFLYIFSFKNTEEQNNLIEQFYDYIPVTVNQYQRKFLNEQDNSIINTDVYKLIKSEIDKNDVDSLKITNDYKCKYKPNNINSWSGESISNMIKKICSEDFLDGSFIFYKKYYDDANCFVHCNILGYYNKDGVIVENYNKADCIKLLHNAIFVTFAYMDCFFQTININLRDNYGYIFQLNDELFQLYKKFFDSEKENDIFCQL